MYDYIIVGAGPSGLALSWYLSNLNKKILLIDREDSLGGCHRVRRVNGLFTEHGPRIYLNNYKNMINILKQMGLSFDNLFVKYEFNMNEISDKIVSNFSIKEIITLSLSYIYFAFNKQPSKHITMLEYSNQHDFSNQAKDYINRLCRLTDGAGIDRYTLYEFFEIINQNMLYNIYQPRLPNDIGLFKYWKAALLKTKNVTIQLNTNLIKINHNISNNLIQSLTIQSNNQMIDVNSKKYILAISPKSLVNILNNSSPNIRNIFGNYADLIKWKNESEYLTYIPIIFHWNEKIKLKKKWGFPSTEWGVASIILSDYMQFKNPLSKTVISTCITLPNNYSEYINKTPNECNQRELKEEVFRQLKTIFHNLPTASVVLVSPGIYYKNNKWHTEDSAFMFTKFGYLNKHQYQNLYTVGTQNGNSIYAFTSMESAITNALFLLHELEPETYKYPILESFTINKLLLNIIISIIICIIIYLIFFSKSFY